MGTKEKKKRRRGPKPKPIPPHSPLYVSKVRELLEYFGTVPSDDEFAQTIGVSRGTLHRWANGEQEVDNQAKLAICGALGIPVDWWDQEGIPVVQVIDQRFRPEIVNIVTLKEGEGPEIIRTPGPLKIESGLHVPELSPTSEALKERAGQQEDGPLFDTVIQKFVTDYTQKHQEMGEIVLRFARQIEKQREEEEGESKEHGRHQLRPKNNPK